MWAFQRVPRLHVAKYARTFSCSSTVLAQSPETDSLSTLIESIDAPASDAPDAVKVSIANPSIRRARSDTGAVNFRFSDAEKYKLATNKYFLHCLTSHSNTLLTLTNYKHEPIMWTSAGLCGFKKAARGGYEAGFRSTTMMLEKMKQKEDDDAAFELKSRTEPQRVQKTQVKKQKPQFRPASIELIIKDFGLGREAVMKALMGVEGDHYRNKITNIVDATPLKFGGVRARAVRRL